MKLESSRSPATARAVLLGTVAAIFAAGAFGQDAAQPALGVPSVDTAADTREQRRTTRDRRRAGRTETPSVEQPAVASPGTAGPLADTVDAKLICRTIKPTGTRVGRRICGTPEQWAASEKASTDAAQEGMRQVRDRSSVVVSQPESPLSPGR